MKEKIIEITDKLKNSEITESEAKEQFLFLFGVSVSLSIQQGVEICGRWEQHLTLFEEDKGVIDEQLKIINTVFKQ